MGIGSPRIAENPGMSIISGHIMGWRLFLAFLALMIHQLDHIGPELRGPLLICEFHFGI